MFTTIWLYIVLPLALMGFAAEFILSKYGTKSFFYFSIALVIASTIALTLALTLFGRDQHYLQEFRAALGITVPTGLVLFLPIGIFVRNENRTFRALLTGMIIMVASAVCMMGILFVGTQSAGV